MEVNGERLWKRIKELGKRNRSNKGGIDRPAFSQADREATDTVIKWMKEANLNITIDAIGNVFGRREGVQRGPSVLTGSHIDAVPNGGMFDGVAGVISSLEVIQTLVENNIKTTLPVEVVIFVNEEGSRFPGGTMGSRALIGELSEDLPYETFDKNGETLSSAMIKYGAKPDKILEARRKSHEIHSFIELHIEQGKILEDLSKPVGIVTSISGTCRLHVEIIGKSGHAGTTPMHLRQDPMVATGIVIKEIERIAIETSPLTRCTTGYIKAFPGGVNVIPSAVEFSIDIRDVDQKI